MKRINVRCGCGVVVKRFEVDDGNTKIEVIDRCGECEHCGLTGEYSLSPNWKWGETWKRRPKNEKKS